MVSEADIEPLFEHTVEYIDLLGGCNLSVDKLSKENGLKLFPNPASHQTHIQFEAKGESYTLQVIDLNGRTVLEPFSGKKLNGEQIIPIDIHSLVNGMYTIRLYNGKEVRSIKLIVSK